MGVPKQVAEMEAEGDKEIASEAEVQVKDPVPTQEEAKPETEAAAETEPNKVSAEAAVVGDKANILADIGRQEPSDEEAKKELQRELSAQGRLKKLDGQLRSQREQYEAKIAELEKSISDLTEKLGRVKIGAASERDDLDDADVFAEIRKEYSPEDYSDDDLKRFISVIKRVGSHDLRAFQKRFDDLDAERAERAKSAAKADADAFVSRLDEDFPGFRKLDSDNDPRWIQFLASSIGGVMEDTTYGDVAKDALRQLNYRKFSSVVREFANRSRIVFSPNAKPGDSTVASQVRPASFSAPNPESTQAQPQFVSAAEIDAFRRAAFARKAEERYGMTRDQVAAQLRFYEDAEAEGRVR